MKMSNRFTVAWWTASVTAFGFLIFLDRRTYWENGTAGYIDGMFIGVWLLLVLRPLFHEMKLPGFSGKVESELLTVDGLKELIKSLSWLQAPDEAASERTADGKAISERDSDDASDSKKEPHSGEAQEKEPISIPETGLEEEEPTARDVASERVIPHRDSTDLGSQLDLNMRLALNSKIRLGRIVDRLWDGQFGKFNRKPNYIFRKKIDDLEKGEVLYPSIARAANELWSISNQLIHGNDIPHEHEHFLRQYGKSVIEQLEQFRTNNW